MAHFPKEAVASKHIVQFYLCLVQSGSWSAGNLPSACEQAAPWHRAWGAAAPRLLQPRRCQAVTPRRLNAANARVTAELAAAAPAHPARTIASAASLELTACLAGHSRPQACSPYHKSTSYYAQALQWPFLKNLPRGIYAVSPTDFQRVNNAI